MRRINIVVEGKTEEQFVKHLLSVYFINKGIALTARSIGRGTSYDKLHFNIVQWLKQDKTAWVSTMIDYYGMNPGFPGFDTDKQKNLYDRIFSIEQCIVDDIKKNVPGNNKFLPYIQVHEFEALLFSEPKEMEAWLSLDTKNINNKFEAIAGKFDSPEHINDSYYTAPSKRIIQICPGYNKVADGIEIARKIGIEAIRKKCLHFDEWLTKLENLNW
jgi:hypothetical protein